jgi:hypothetical protein
MYKTLSKSVKIIFFCIFLNENVLHTTLIKLGGLVVIVITEIRLINKYRIFTLSHE